MINKGEKGHYCSQWAEMSAQLMRWQPRETTGFLRKMRAKIAIGRKISARSTRLASKGPSETGQERREGRDLRGG